MCGGGSSDYKEKPEVLLSREFRDELGVEINEQALRMFIRTRWHRVSTLAHAIHGSNEFKDGRTSSANPNIGKQGQY